MELEPARLEAFAAAVRPRLAGDLRLDALSKALYATDASLYREPPLGVLIPKHADDVQAALEAAAQYGVPLAARGSGSSLAGSAVSGGLVVDTTKHLGAIVALDAEARTATVQPGVVLDDLNRAAAVHGLTIGPDPASSNRATLGGMLGTNATGTHSIQYGAVVDWTESARVLLADGTPADFGALSPEAWAHQARQSGTLGDVTKRVDALLTVHEHAIRTDTARWWRRAGGYRLERMMEAPEVDRGPGRAWDGTRNLAHLLAGSEGTLAFATEITLGLVEKPAHAALGVVHYPSRMGALEAVEGILETGPTAVELFDRIALERALDVTEYAPKLHFVQCGPHGELPAALLIVEYSGASLAECREGLASLRRHLGAGAVITDLEEEARMADVYAVRKVGLGLAMSARLPVQAAAIIEDAAVPVEHLPAYIRELEEAMAADSVEAVIYAHASAGCLHVRPFLDLRQPQQVAAMERIARASARLAKTYGGVIASEHGDGRARGALAEEFYSPALYAAYQATKRAFDPGGRLNPGKIVDVPPLTEALRMGPDYRPSPVATGLAFYDSAGQDIGFTAAVEACNGSAVCRKTDVGTMCPPFMATREEKDSTRGRANALREALSGGLDSLTGPEVAEALDLCVSCKACKAECPASVDMAALKTVWQSKKWETETPSPRTRLFAHLPVVARRVAGPLARVANVVNRLPPARAALAAIGVSRERALPAFATRPFSEKEAPTPTGDGPRVALFADTFGRFQEPSIPRAALAVLTAAGARVEVPPYRCCGRTYVSKGYLPHATRLAHRLVETYAPLAHDGVAIVGLEPSCILTLRDEIPRLVQSDDARAVAAAAVTFEEWCAAHADRLAALDWAGAGDALVHGHCHQKALSTMAASHACLGAAGLAVSETKAGCCGVAGAFGYEAEHYDVSVAIAEDRLAPAVRAAPDAVVVAAGTSCREQIEHTTGRRALHPAEALAARLR
ncbi:FAD-binding and (Fe-S)-binding domain-containing protein [Rubrivirga sp. IMCC45206]|uniref:FAD-binding and (Fe-S)-binding domain-containing protein n=1 Tax=Rubrivirga sp. IMCC45206 TaxID=3391614 RepID=UPI003990173A